MEPTIPSPYPDARATISGDTLTLTAWDVRLRPTGVLSQSSQSVAFADLRFLVALDGAYEVIVTHDVPAVLNDEIRGVVIRWAREVGQRRIFFPNEIVELDDALPASTIAESECAICGTRMSGEGFEFWAGIRRAGCFPNRCAACGSVLAQWTVQKDSA